MKKYNGKYFKDLIKSQGRTQKWVAEQMGLSRPNLSMKLNMIGSAKLNEREKQLLEEILK